MWAHFGVWRERNGCVKAGIAMGRWLGVRGLVLYPGNYYLDRVLDTFR